MKKLLLLASLTCVVAFCQQAIKPGGYSHHGEVPLTAVPTSATAFFSTAALITPGSGITANVNVRSVYLVNTTNATITVTVSCTSGATVLIAVAVPGVTTGGNNIPIQFPSDGVTCPGGLTWIASAAGVNAYAAVDY